LPNAGLRQPAPLNFGVGACHGRDVDCESLRESSVRRQARAILELAAVDGTRHSIGDR
jgi:hypothetical protein